MVHQYQNVLTLGVCKEFLYLMEGGTEVPGAELLPLTDQGCAAPGGRRLRVSLNKEENWCLFTQKSER